MSREIDQEIKRQKDHLQEEVHQLKMLGIIEDKQSIPLQEYIRIYDIESEYEDILQKKVIDLTTHDRIIAILFWIKYGKMLG